MADQKISALTALAALTPDDLLAVVNDPSGTPSTRKVPFSVVDARMAHVTVGANGQYATIDLAVAALASTGGKITVQPGAYDPCTLDDNIWLSFEPGAVITIPNDSQENGIMIDALENVRVSGARVMGNKALVDNEGDLYETINGIYVRNSENVLIENCYCAEAYFGGIAVGLSTNVYLFHNRCVDNRDNGIFLRPSNVNVVIIGNIVSGSEFSGIQSLRSDYVQVIGNICYSNGPTLAEGDGIGFEGCRYSKIDSNIIYSNGIQGIKVDYTVEGGEPEIRSLDCVISNNTIYDHTDSGNGCGIEVLRSDYTVIENNKIKTCKYGINVGEVVGIVIKGNHVKSTSSQGIRLHDGATTGYLLVQDNIVELSGDHQIEFFQNNVHIIGNTVRAGSAQGIRISNGDNFYIANNTIFDNADNGILKSSDAGAGDIVDNHFFNTGTAQDRAVYEEASGGILRMANNRIEGMNTEPYQLNTVGSYVVDDGTRKLTVVPSNDHQVSGNIADFTAGENLVFGDFCYFKSDGKMWKADADAIATSSSLFMAMATIAADASGLFALPDSIIRDDTWAWTVGGPIYLSTTAGAATQTAPSGTDDVIQVLGVATHADRMFFRPSLVQVEHA